MIKKIIIAFNVLLLFAAVPAMAASKSAHQVAKKSITQQASARHALKVKKSAKKKTRGKKTSSRSSGGTFSVAAASDSVSKTGNQPPPGYMRAVNNALNHFLSAKRSARGNHAKLKAAEERYDAELGTAEAMLGP